MISVSGATAWQLRSKPVGLSQETAADPEMVRNTLPDVAEGEAEINVLQESCFFFFFSSVLLLWDDRAGKCRVQTLDALPANKATSTSRSGQTFYFSCLGSSEQLDSLLPSSAAEVPGAD